MEMYQLAARSEQPRTNSFRRFSIPLPQASSLGLLRELIYNELLNVTLGTPPSTTLTDKQLRDVFDVLPVVPGTIVVAYPILVDLRRLLNQAVTEQQETTTGLLPGRDKASIQIALDYLVTVVCGNLMIVRS